MTEDSENNENKVSQDNTCNENQTIIDIDGQVNISNITKITHIEIGHSKENIRDMNPVKDGDNDQIRFGAGTKPKAKIVTDNEEKENILNMKHFTSSDNGHKHSSAINNAKEKRFKHSDNHAIHLRNLQNKDQDKYDTLHLTGVKRVSFILCIVNFGAVFIVMFIYFLLLSLLSKLQKLSK